MEQDDDDSPVTAGDLAYALPGSGSPDQWSRAADGDGPGVSPTPPDNLGAATPPASKLRRWGEVEKDPVFQSANAGTQEKMRSAYLSAFEKDTAFTSLPPESQDKVRARISSGGPKLPNPVIAAAKAAGQLIGHSMRLGKDALEVGSEKSLDATGRALSEIAATGAGLSSEPLPNIDSPGIVDRITKSAAAVEKQLKTPPTDEEANDHPIATALHITRPIRALGAFIQESLPEYPAYAKWEARSKLGSLRATLDQITAGVKKEDYAHARALAPVEDGEQPVGKIIQRAAYETVADAVNAAGEFGASLTSPSGFLENELMMKGGGKLGGAALEGLVRAAPELALKASLPVTAADMSAAIEGASRGETVQPAAYRHVDHVVMRNVENSLDAIGEKLGPDATPQAVKAAMDDVAKRSYEVLARKVYGMKLRGEMSPVDGPQLRPEQGPPALEMQGPGTDHPVKMEPAPIEPKHQPIDPNHVATTVLAAGVDGPQVQAMSQRFPWVYASASNLADIPTAARAPYTAWADNLARSLNLPPGTPIGPDGIAFAIRTGKANLIELEKVNKAIFEAEAAAQGAHPDTVNRIYADAQAAAERPAEALVAHHAQAQAVDAFREAKAQADGVTRLEAVRAANGGLPEGDQPQTIAQAAPEAPAVPHEVPGRTDGLSAAAEQGAPLVDAVEAHRSAALEAQEAGTLDHEVAQEYVDHGDTSFDPAALEAESHPFPDLEKHPAEMTLAEFKTAFPDVPADVAAEVHKSMVDEAAYHMEQEARVDRKETLRSSGISAQPLHDFLKKNPIGKEWIDKLGLGGEFRQFKESGLIVDGGTDDNKVDYRLGKAIEAGLLPEGASINDLVEQLDHEARKGSRREAQASMVREGDEGTQSPGEQPEQPVPSYKKALPADEKAARETLLQEGPFLRAYPYTHSIGGKPFVVNSIVDDLALHEALVHGGDPTDKAFLKERSLVYHDAGKPNLSKILAGQKAKEDVTALRAILEEQMFKMTVLLNRNDPGPASTPKWILKARADAEKPDSSGPSTVADAPSAVTDTPEFKKWFGDSKVVDKDGKPIVMYHGTAEGGLQGDAFDKSLLGSVTKSRSARAGFFFVSNEGIASGYSNLANAKPVADLVAKSEAAEREKNWDLARELIEKAERLEQNNNPDEHIVAAYLSIKNPLEFDAQEQRFLDIQDEIHDAIKSARSGGHDGIVFRNLIDNADWGSSTAADHWVAFEPTQIKSATGNSGAFDPKNPSILKEAPSQKLFLTYAGKSYPVASINEASAMWDKVRDEAMNQGAGPDDMGSKPLITDGSGKTLGYVSWNGRVWKGDPMAPHDAKREWLDDATVQQIEMDLGPTLGPKFAKEGRLSYRGLSAEHKAEIADIVKAARLKGVEHLHLVFRSKTGAKKAHMDMSFNHPSKGGMSPEDKTAALKIFDKLGGKKAGITVESVHNHPAGDPTPSGDDHGFHKDMDAMFKGAYTGTLVTNGEQFAVIDNNGHHFEKFNSPLPQHYKPQGPVVTTPNEIVAQAAKDAMLGKSYIVLFKDARSRVISIEHFDRGENIPASVKAGILRHKASSADIVAPASAAVPLDLPGEVGPITHVDEDGKPSAVSYQPRGESAYGALKNTMTSSMVSDEQLPRYMGTNGMDAHDFEQALADGKIEAKSPVTARVKLEGVKRGEKGVVVGIDKKGVRLLVKFADQLVPVAVRPENIVETYRKPGARAAVEAAEMMAEKSGQPSQPIKRTIEEQQAGLSKEYVTQTVRQALQARFRAETFAARVAARATKADMTAQFRIKFDELRVDLRSDAQALKARLASQKAGVEWAKEQIVKYIKTNLPLSARGKFLDLVKNIDNPLDAQDAFSRVDAEASLIYKKGIIEDLNKLALRATDSPSIAIEEKRLIREFMGELTAGQKNLSQKMRQVDDYFGKPGEPGHGSEAVKFVWTQLRRLGKGAAKDLPESFFEDALDRLSVLVRVGKDKQWMRENIAELEKQLFIEKLIGAKAPKHEYGKRIRGKNLSKPTAWESSVVNKWLAASDWAQRNWLSIKPTDAMLDDLGGNPGQYSNPLMAFKKEIDSHYWDRMDERTKVMDGYQKAINGLPEKGRAEAFKRIGIVLDREQKGGMERLLARKDLDKAFIDGVVLTPVEEAVRAYMRSYMDMIFPRAEQVMAEAENRPLRKVMNYFTFMTDREAQLGTQIEQRSIFDPGMNLNAEAHPQTPAAGSFKKHRGANVPPVEIDADRVFRAYVDKSLHVAHLFKPLKKYAGIFSSKEFGDVVGGETQSAMKEYLEVLARDGGADKAKKLEWLDWLKNQAGAGLVPWHITPALLHGAKWFNCPMFFGPKAALEAAADFSSPNPAWREAAARNVPEWRERSGYDDPAYSEIGMWDWLKKANKTGLIPLRVAEKWSSGCTLVAAYKDAMRKRGLDPQADMNNRDAWLDAAVLMRRADGSPFYKDTPLVIAAGRGLFENVSVNRAFLQFKATPLNRLSQLTHDLPAKFKENKAEGAMFAGLLAGAHAAEAGARVAGSYLHIALLGLLGFETKKLLEKEDKKQDEFAQDLILSFFRDAPGFDQAIGMAKYRETGVAAIDSPVNMVHGAWQMTHAKTNAGAMHGFWDAFNGVSGLLGFGLMTEIGFMLQKVMTGQKKPGYQAQLDQLRKTPASQLTRTDIAEKSHLEIGAMDWEHQRVALAAAFDKHDIQGMARAAEGMRDNLKAMET